MRIVRMLKIIVKVIGIGNDSIENDSKSDNKSDNKNDGKNDNIENDGIENSVLKIVYWKW